MSTSPLFTLRLAFRSAALLALLAAPALADGPFSFFTVSPCRLYDSRNLPATALQDATPRIVQATGSCGIPSTAKAVVFNVTAVGPTNPGWIELYPSDVARPGTSTVNFPAGVTALANGAIVPLSATGQVTAYASLYQAGPTSQVHLVLDVTGYFVPEATVVVAAGPGSAASLIAGAAAR